MQELTAHRASLLVILAVAFAVRMGAAWWWESRLPAGVQFGLPDSDSYWQLARTIANGQPYQYPTNEFRIIRTPGYPALLAPLFVVGKNDPPVLWARWLGAVLGTLAVGGVAWLAGRLFDKRASLLAAAAAAVYPGGVALSVFVLSEAPFCPLMVLHLVLWCLAWQAARRSHCLAWAFAGGVVAAAATLMRPSWLLFIPFALVVGLLTNRERGRHLAIGGIMLAGLALAMCPWWVRNYRVTGRFVPTTLQTGASLYDGLSPEATGASQMDFAVKFYWQQKREDKAQAEPPAELFEVRLDRRMRDAALDWARQHPADALRLAWIKFVRMWNVWPNASDLRSVGLRLVVALGYAPLLVGGLVGAARFVRRGWPYWLCILPSVYFTCLHVVFVSSIRYRQPPMLVVIVLAAGVCSELWQARQSRRSGRAGG